MSEIVNNINNLTRQQDFQHTAPTTLQYTQRKLLEKWATKAQCKLLLRISKRKKFLSNWTHQRPYVRPFLITTW